jgi:hypothetical protein
MVFTGSDMTYSKPCSYCSLKVMTTTDLTYHSRKTAVTNDV